MQKGNLTNVLHARSEISFSGCLNFWISRHIIKYIHTQIHIAITTQTYRFPMRSSDQLSLVIPRTRKYSWRTSIFGCRTSFLELSFFVLLRFAQSQIFKILPYYDNYGLVLMRHQLIRQAVDTRATKLLITITISRMSFLLIRHYEIFENLAFQANE